MTVSEIKEYIDYTLNDVNSASVLIYRQRLRNIKFMLDELDDRPKAKWVATERHLYMCCNCESEFIETSEHNYCPMCGARMEVEQ